MVSASSNRERVLLHDQPVLEGAPAPNSSAVAYHVVGTRRGMGHRLPLGGGGKRRAAAAQQLGVAQLAQHPLGAQLDSAAQGGVPPVAAIVVDALGSRRADPPQQGQLRRRGGPVGLRSRRAGGGGWRRGNRLRGAGWGVAAGWAGGVLAARRERGTDRLRVRRGEIVVSRSPASCRSTAGARSQSPRHGLVIQVMRGRAVPECGAAAELAVG